MTNKKMEKKITNDFTKEINNCSNIEIFFNYSKRNEYKPDIVSSPGETILDILEEQGMSQKELAQKIGYSDKVIEKLLEGKTEITINMAYQLEKVFCIPVNFWINRELNYRKYKKNLLL